MRRTRNGHSRRALFLVHAQPVPLPQEVVAFAADHLPPRLARLLTNATSGAAMRALPASGYTNEEAMAYVGVKRRVWEELWRPRLVAIRQGSMLLFDRHDLDRVFDDFKAQAAGEQNSAVASQPPDAKTRTTTASSQRASGQPIGAFAKTASMVMRKKSERSKA